MNYSVQTPTGPQPVAACVLLPVNYQNGHHYPAIVNVYPEQNGSRCLPNRRGEREIGFSGVADFDHLLAAHGYIVFEPDTEDRFTRTSEGPIWAMPDVVVQGVDALTSQGFADPNRLGLFGYSQGGVSSLWVASKTNIFKAVVSMNGWSDYYTHFFEPSYSMRGDTAIFQYSGNTLRFMSVVGGPFGFGKSPSQAPNLYTSNSPLLRADSMNAPILLIHSDMDGFSMAEYEAMFTALNLNRKEAKLLEYWGEGHSPSSPENMRNMWQNIFDWYDKYLVDGNAKAANPSPPTPN
jgi:dipeptidyl aminopeptidase/acylaminoacyl peptidase